MSYSLNKVQLIGNVGKDPDVRFTQDGKPIATLSVATSESWKDKAGEKQEKVEWHRVVIFNKPLAEMAAPKLVLKNRALPELLWNWAADGQG